ncbi:ThuA-like domain-containing protein [Sparassis latifolia]|uniref:Class I glutamine amidotransferase-like protein n=1 Tax=Sparassis crispa TaxID=139825 RepID=A0A401H260_9APHY|nr:class I glutamine amidotransferase-like protein [Sparassis crispa]GBE88536.1 class I glutamine amidotransferase-like protein [Sparassis crispa]
MPPTARILIYSATRGYRHDSIPMSIEILNVKGPSINVQFDATEDETWFTDDRLKEYDALLFLNNSGEVLDEAGKAAFQNYLNLGGNFIGIHCASACLYECEFYRKEIGALFDYHPEISTGVIEVLDQNHPTTKMLPPKWEVFDEMYNFRSDPRSVGAKVILIADETSYKDDGERKYDHGTPHPMAWYQERGAGVESTGTAGRSWYTALGHGEETWRDDLFIAHVLAGIQWALGSNTTKAFNPNVQVGNA